MTANARPEEENRPGFCAVDRVERPNERCTEIVSATIGGTPMTLLVRCTNAYPGEDGAWKLAHHHMDLLPDVAAVFPNTLARAN